MRLSNWLNHFNLDTAEIDSLILRRRALADNIRRGRMLAMIIICFELIFAVMDISALLMHISNKFHYLFYLGLYGLMILANLLFLLLSQKHDQNRELAPADILKQENGILAYITFNLVWGSLISLLDQELYGQLIVFMVNMITISVVFIIDRRKLRIPFLLSTAFLAIGLPFYQPSSDILIGHYVNLSVFIIIAWISSQLLYQAYVNNLASNLELERTIRLLAAESAQNSLINEKLSQANFQLRQLSLVDELTGLANRRGLRNFISQIFSQTDSPVENMAVIMIDIDHFKQYNDSYGHFAGDQVLVSIAKVLDGNISSSWELAARWGGEEFVLLSFKINARALAELADKIRRQVEALGIIHESSPTSNLVTVSLGTSLQAVKGETDVSPVIESADIAMYEAKKAGRNRVMANLPEPTDPAGDAKPESTSLPADIRLIQATSREQAADAAELARKIWTEHYTSIIGADQVEYMISRFQNSDKIWQDIQNQAFQYDLIEVQGELAGYMAVQQDDKRQAFFLSKLYVDQKFRRRGLGRHLLSTLISRCEQKGYRRIWLTVNKNNLGSIEAYERLGFVRVDAVVNDIGGGYVMDDYIMELTW